MSFLISRIVPLLQIKPIKRDAKDAVSELNGQKIKGCRVRLEMSDGPGNRKSGTSYEETTVYSTMREERGFNPRVRFSSSYLIFVA